MRARTNDRKIRVLTLFCLLFLLTAALVTRAQQSL